MQAYLDHSEAGQPVGGAGFVLNVYDLELQQSLAIGSRDQLVWGIGERLSDYHIANSTTLLFLPSHRWLNLGNAFAQATIGLSANVNLTAGVKLEDDPYSHWTAMPDVRLAWTLGQGAFLWAAASRAIRSPTPFDVDVVEKLGSVVFLTGDANFRPEKVTAYEIGYRGRPREWVTLSATAYYNVYDDLRTVEPASAAIFLPLHWDNQMSGDTYGVEGWADIQITSWWRLSPGFRSFHERLRFKPGASGLLGLAQAGDDPATRAALKSSLNLGRDLTFDAMVRHVAALPDPPVAAYYEVNARLGWHASTSCELALDGYNLNHSRHQEFPVPAGEFIQRGFMIDAIWRF